MKRTWAKPTNLWQWLLLLTPAMVSISAPLLGGLVERWTHPSVSDPYAPLGWGFFGLLIALAMSPAIGAWLARKNVSPGKKAVAGAVCTLVIIVVNSFAAFAGCAVLAIGVAPRK
jgi:hypothetical protein